jgi:hydroxymethylpyrimidine pyrophosphatase-like HAD family hydrolase
MRYQALACDYDGTLAFDGRVAPETIRALERLKRDRRTLLMVSGRELDDLRRVFSRLDLFERVVVENGALLYRPAADEAVPLAPPPNDRFVRRLRELGIMPLAVGRTIVATRVPNEVAVLETIRELGLELQVIFNKGAVMVLPAGVNKCTGLKTALEELGMAPQATVGVGDAENDHAFLQFCGLGVAVANALPSLKEEADLVTRHARGEGVVELIERLLKDDLPTRAARPAAAARRG